MVAYISQLAAQNPQVADMQRIFQSQQAAYALRPMPSANERLANLRRLKDAILKF